MTAPSAGGRKEAGRTRAARQMRGDDEGVDEADRLVDVPELMDSANTLTNPDNFEKRRRGLRRRKRSDDEL